MRKLGYVVLGLALLVGSLALAGYRHLPQNASNSKSAPISANRSIQAAPPAASQRNPSGGQSQTLSGVQIFEMGLNMANVVVGLLGIWMTMRGFRAERRAEQAMALRRER